MLIVSAAIATLSACAAYGPGDLRAGDVEAQVLASMGPATLRLTDAAGGTRLVFARGPYGRHTWMVDLDAGGRVVRWHQALGERQFADLPAGIDTAALLRRLGPPAQKRPRGLKPGEVWSYRYPTNDCLWFQVETDAAGLVLGGSYATDPSCDINDRASPP